MTRRHRSERGHSFPSLRPDIGIVPSRQRIDEIDCLELHWWFVIPRLGDHTMSAAYEVDTLALALVTDLVATAPARIHQVDCVEIQVKEEIQTNGPARGGWPIQFSPGLVYGRIEQEETRWIAVARDSGGTRVLSTFLDEGFERDWGAGRRKLYDDGRYQSQADGSYRITDGKGLGAGVYDVTIAGKTFCCLRVLDPDLSVPGGGELVEAYLERGGRTVFFRRYDGRSYRGVDLVQKYPNNLRIEIDGCVYVHCDCTGRAHDTITNTPLGLDV
jgi:hypothetical protein